MFGYCSCKFLPLPLINNMGDQVNDEFLILHNQILILQFGDYILEVFIVVTGISGPCDYHPNGFLELGPCLLIHLVKFEHVDEALESLDDLLASPLRQTVLVNHNDELELPDFGKHCLQEVRHPDCPHVVP